MIIVHVVTHYYPILGGLERVVYYIAKEQAKVGHEIHIITSANPLLKQKNEITEGIHVHRVKTRSLGIPDLILPLEFPQILLKQLDVLHIHSHNSLFNIKMAEYAKNLGCTIVTHFMAVRALRRHPNIVKRVLGSLYQEYMTKKAIKLTDIPLVKSLRDLHILSSEYGIKPIYVPDGISEDYFTKPKDPEHFKRLYNIYEDNIFLYIGRMHPVKGPQILIKAFARALKIIKNSRLLLIGPGPVNWLKKIAKKLSVEKHVTFMGPVKEHVKISAIDASTAIIIPSLYDYVETFSLVTSEAWARGKPVIASKIGELAYRIKHGVDGILVPPNDTKALAKALIEVANNPFKVPLKKLMTWNKVAKRLYTIYTSL